MSTRDILCRTHPVCMRINCLHGAYRTGFLSSPREVNVVIASGWQADTVCRVDSTYGCMRMEVLYAHVRDLIKVLLFYPGPPLLDPLTSRHYFPLTSRHYFSFHSLAILHNNDSLVQEGNLYTDQTMVR